MSQAWAYTLIGDFNFPAGIAGSSGVLGRVNKCVLISATGPQTNVANGSALDVSSDLTKVAAGFQVGYKNHADTPFRMELVLAAGNSGADLLVKSLRLTETYVVAVTAAVVLTGVEQRFLLFGWD
jgi:hypothetical protein